MKNTLFFLLIATVIQINLLATGTPSEISEALHRHNQAVHIHDHWIRDPYIMIGPDQQYYMTGTTIDHESDQVIGIPSWKSEDLVNWEKMPRLWSFKDSSWIDPNMKTRHNFGKPLVWAPELYHINGRWIVLHTTNARFANLMLTKGKELEGPLMEPMKFDFGARHDPAIFMDAEQPWLIWACTKIRKLKKDFSGFDGPEYSIAPSNRTMGHEGAYILKIDHKYVLFGTAWSTDTMRHGTYNLYYCTADKITGPYSERRFAGRCLGHGTPFKDKEGKWWCTAFYNANVPTLSGEEMSSQNVEDTAYTLNKQGTTLVPMEVRVASDGDVFVRAKDRYYATPGQEEVQKF